MKPSKITPAIRKRCAEVAALKLQTPTYKQLEVETGIHRNYLAKVVHEIVTAHSNENSLLHVEQTPLP